MNKTELMEFIIFLESKGVRFEVTGFCGAKCYANPEYLKQYVEEFVSSI